MRKKYSKKIIINIEKLTENMIIIGKDINKKEVELEIKEMLLKVVNSISDYTTETSPEI